MSFPRWSPDGQVLAFVGRRRGWSQVWLVDAPIPRRGRPARDPQPPEPAPLTATGFDVEDLVWLADGRSVAVMAFRAPDHDAGSIHLVDVASGDGDDGSPAAAIEWAAGPRPLAGRRPALHDRRRRLVPGRPASRPTPASGRS